MRFAAILLLAVLVGCSGKSGPSYAEVLATYEAESAVLERLERQAKEAATERDAAIKAADEKYKADIAELETFDDFVYDTKDPDKRAERVQRHEEMRDTIANTKEISHRLAKSAYDETMSKLNPEIESQRKRVEFAKQARDEAENQR